MTDRKQGFQLVGSSIKVKIRNIVRMLDVVCQHFVENGGSSSVSSPPLESISSSHLQQKTKNLGDTIDILSLYFVALFSFVLYHKLTPNAVQIGLILAVDALKDIFSLLARSSSSSQHQHYYRSLFQEANGDDVAKFPCDPSSPPASNTFEHERRARENDATNTNNAGIKNNTPRGVWSIPPTQEEDDFVGSLEDETEPTQRGKKGDNGDAPQQQEGDVVVEETQLPPCQEDGFSSLHPYNLPEWALPSEFYLCSVYYRSSQYIPIPECNFCKYKEVLDHAQSRVDHYKGAFARDFKKYCAVHHGGFGLCDTMKQQLKVEFARSGRGRWCVGKIVGWFKIAVAACVLMRDGHTKYGHSRIHKVDWCELSLFESPRYIATDDDLEHTFSSSLSDNRKPSRQSQLVDARFDLQYY
eukprot:TRINITY_DN3074_c0_g1_i1.p1 TRINITY_DN3074_c0_g1~~TRINITY_DN3074_c0_g1_i1.p1  ORF type:complete len:413 (+),score=33.06 TRINITY_DN3074_c0_g1_i1:29-1267(+)